MVMLIVYVLLGILDLGLITAGASVRVVQQFERGVVFRFGRVRAETREPGLALIAPVMDRLHKVSMQIITLPVPAQDGITRDNVTVRVDAVVYYRVIDAVRVWMSRTTTPRSARSRRPPCARSSARATWTTCCPTRNASTKASS